MFGVDWSYPAAILSSRRELVSDLKHHWPRSEVSKSMNSSLLKCIAKERIANIASTRGFRDCSNSEDDETNFSIVIMASRVTLESCSSTFTFEDVEESQILQLVLDITPELSRVNVKVLALAHAICPSRIIARQR